MEICICFLLVSLSICIFFTKAAAASDFGETKAMAKQGNFKAQYQLALMYEDGDGVKQDYAQAFYWHRQAAEQGYDWSQYNLGLMYSKGRGVKQDYIQAAAWYSKAAEQGHSSAQHNLGIMYDYGQGMQQDYARAVYWYRKAAEQGYSGAQCNLGLMYSKGLGVKQDYIQAVALYRKAAEQGHPDAQSNLSAMYADGRGVPRDGDQAIFWLRKSVERDIADLQEDLGELYDKSRDYLMQRLGYIFYYYSFQHKVLPSIFLNNPGKILEDMELPEIVLSKLLAVGFDDANERGLIKLEDREDKKEREEEYKIIDTIDHCRQIPYWFYSVCIDCVQSVLGRKITLEKHSYPDKDVFILKFLALTAWSSPMCERIYFISNKERSKFALYTVEMAGRNYEKSPFGKISIESNDMGEFMICGHTKDGAHVNYGTAPIGEKMISAKIFDLFSRGRGIF